MANVYITKKEFKEKNYTEIMYKLFEDNKEIGNLNLLYIPKEMINSSNELIKISNNQFKDAYTMLKENKIHQDLIIIEYLYINSKYRGNGYAKCLLNNIKKENTAYFTFAILLEIEDFFIDKEVENNRSMLHNLYEPIFGDGIIKNKGQGFYFLSQL